MASLWWWMPYINMSKKKNPFPLKLDAIRFNTLVSARATSYNMCIIYTFATSSSTSLSGESKNNSVCSIYVCVLHNFSISSTTDLTHSCGSRTLNRNIWLNRVGTVLNNITFYSTSRQSLSSRKMHHADTTPTERDWESHDRSVSKMECVLSCERNILLLARGIAADNISAGNYAKISSHDITYARNCYITPLPIDDYSYSLLVDMRIVAVIKQMHSFAITCAFYKCLD